MTRDYQPGEAFVDPGGGSLHEGRKDSENEVLEYVVFLGVSAAR